MNRLKLLLLTASVVAVTAFSSIIGACYAEQNSTAVKPAAENGTAAAVPSAAEEAAAAQRKADAAARALAKRAEMLKQRKASKEYIQKVVEGQQPAPAAPAPVDAGTGGAQ